MTGSEFAKTLMGVDPRLDADLIARAQRALRAVPADLTPSPADTAGAAGAAGEGQWSLPAGALDYWTSLQGSG